MTNQLKPTITTGDLIVRLAAVIAALAATAILVMSLPQVKHSLVLATTQMPEPYTQLSFRDYQTLPGQAVVGNSYPVSYQIINHETITTTYHVRVTAIQNGHSLLLSDQTFQLATDQTQNLTTKFTPTVKAAHYQIVVELVGRNQTIHFWSQS